jgi:hypothetical protein
MKAITNTATKAVHNSLLICPRKMHKSQMNANGQFSRHELRSQGRIPSFKLRSLRGEISYLLLKLACMAKEPFYRCE